MAMARSVDVRAVQCSERCACSRCAQNCPAESAAVAVSGAGRSASIGVERREAPARSAEASAGRPSPRKLCSVPWNNQASGSRSGFRRARRRAPARRRDQQVAAARSRRLPGERRPGRHPARRAVETRGARRAGCRRSSPAARGSRATSPARHAARRGGGRARRGARTSRARGRTRPRPCHAAGSPPPSAGSSLQRGERLAARPLDLAARQCAADAVRQAVHERILAAENAGQAAAPSPAHTTRAVVVSVSSATRRSRSPLTCSVPESTSHRRAGERGCCPAHPHGRGTRWSTAATPR